MDALPASHRKLAELVIICQVNALNKLSQGLKTELQQLLNISIKFFDFSNICLFLLRKNGSPLCLTASRENAGCTEIQQKLQQMLAAGSDGDGPVNRLEALGPVKSTTLPVLLRPGDPMGVMEMGIFNSEPATAEHLLIKAASLGRHMANIIQESFIHKHKDRQLRKLAVWLETINTISSTPDIRQVLHVVAQLAADLFAARTCIYLLDEREQTITSVAAVGSYDLEMKQKIKALKGRPPFPGIKRALKTRRPLLITPQNIEQFLPREVITDFAYSSLVMAPLLSKKGSIGVMQVDRPGALIAFTTEEAEIIFALARETAIALENARLVQVLAEKEQLLRRLLNKLITVQEDERKRIAYELHDGIIQALIAVWYRLQRLSASDEIPLAGERSEISRLVGLIGEQIQDIRCLIQNMRPITLDDYGLIPAIEFYIDNYKEIHHISVDFKVIGEAYRLPPDIELSLYRILQEALSNVVKHAQATRAWISLDMTGKEILLTISDNGSGFTLNRGKRKQQDRLGLASMQERTSLLGGTFAIHSEKEQGTTITIRIPAGDIDMP
ncbi:GAF domain-containing sensor histidine kinase [Desulfotomaculum copahuensis]|uniref:histidine kinase n=1 Tax=Desulfotomaculum copahuensis TaxID=1838280 RepID=A0A1B7LGX9_9FIRM|nr:GAF domain-containing sensor histidine kinase [Desulfotomaculum copahuensis]OAT85269.1 hypothetical protein A6M21_06940 [Desulfotomaculum copahuensis]